MLNQKATALSASFAIDSGASFWRIPASMKTALLVFATIVAMNAAEPRHHRTILSAANGTREQEWTLAPEGEKWSVKKSTLHGGKQEGVDIINVHNGKLQFTVCPTRGMGLLLAEMDGVWLGWKSPVKETVHPQYINLESRGGLGWLEGFNELMVRCGLEFAGHPGKDKFINNVGDEAEMDLTLHGKIGNIPASEVEVIVDANGLIRVRGRVDERMFYGPKLEMWTEYSTMPGSDSFTIHDTIVNHGAHDQEFQLIYHSNFGPTLLEEGSRFYGAVERVAPFNDNAARAVNSWTEYKGPTKGFIEQVYCVFPRANSDGRTTIMLQNGSGSQAVSITYSTKELPYLTLWKNTAAMEEGYVTGLEPGTGFPFNRGVERKAGRVPKLKPGETREFTLVYQVHKSSESIAEARKKIAAIQGEAKPTIDQAPLPKPQ
jgi:hypothetical protein